MMITINDKHHLLLLPKNITKEKFLSYAKVRKGSYFYKKLESIYLGLTTSIVDVEKEYKKYYNEYDTFSNFLYHKYLYLDADTLKLIINAVESKKYIFVRGRIFQLSDFNLRTLLDVSDTFPQKINNLLKAELYED